jgi:hypothetical protein
VREASDKNSATFPAWQICLSKGDNWFIPAPNELSRYRNGTTTQWENNTATHFWTAEGGDRYINVRYPNGSTSSQVTASYYVFGHDHVQSYTNTNSWAGVVNQNSKAVLCAKAWIYED